MPTSARGTMWTFFLQGWHAGRCGHRPLRNCHRHKCHCNNRRVSKSVPNIKPIWNYSCFRIAGWIFFRNVFLWVIFFALGFELHFQKQGQLDATHRFALWNCHGRKRPRNDNNVVPEIATPVCALDRNNRLTTELPPSRLMPWHLPHNEGGRAFQQCQQVAFGM